ncbi:MAG: acyl-CoA dehydrogenase family protein [Novosphingobium sp.]|nr:acyl-CoA dehydrogenase family protein [Novosphingobium sp.]
MENTAEAITGERRTSEHLDTDEQRAFRLRAREYMAANLPPRIPGQPANSFEDLELVALDREIQRKLYDGGLGGYAGITVPEEYGGLGLDRRFEDIFFEEAEPYRLPWHYGNAVVIVLPCLLAHGTEEQKKKYIPKILSGEHLWAQLLSEPSGGSDLAGVLTRAEKRGDEWVLNGSKVWTSGGHVSDMGLCLARTDPTVRKHAGLTMFLVDMHQPGMSVHPIRLVRGGSDFCQEFLDDVIVPDGDVLGEVNDGWTVARTQLNSERAGMARGWHYGLRRAEASEHIVISSRYKRLAEELGVVDDVDARQLIGEAIVLDAVYDLTSKRAAAGMRSGALPATIGMVTSLLSARTSIDRTALMSALAGPAGVVAAPGSDGPDIGLDRVVTHRIGGGTLEMQLNLVSERHLGLPREPSFDRDVPFNQIKHNATPKLAG